MSLFDQLVNEALRNQAGLAPLRPVVEKELLHHDILREMNATGLLRKLTFFGGTCLRMCYGSLRLSEDLDFSGGANFRPSELQDLPRILTENLFDKYNLAVSVSEPNREEGNVDTWKIRIITRPDRPDLPAQCIHLDICSVPSHHRRPMLLRNPYGVEMGTSGLIIQAESLDEILADKVIALALRQGKIKNRDLWDIAWLQQRNIQLDKTLLLAKFADRSLSPANFHSKLTARLEELASSPSLHKAFVAEMSRFLPPTHSPTIASPEYWQALVFAIRQFTPLMEPPAPPSLENIS